MTTKALRPRTECAAMEHATVGERRCPLRPAALHHRHHAAFHAGDREHPEDLRGASAKDATSWKSWISPNIRRWPIGEQIIAAPTLIKKLPLPLRRFIGDMSQTERILLGLDLRKAAAKKTLSPNRKFLMAKKIPTEQTLLDENPELRARLEEAEDTLRAIRGGEVDALVVEGAEGPESTRCMAWMPHRTASAARSSRRSATPSSQSTATSVSPI